MVLERFCGLERQLTGHVENEDKSIDALVRRMVGPHEGVGAWCVPDLHLGLRATFGSDEL